MSLTRLQIDSPLGRWTAHEWRPAHLRSMVDYLWHFATDIADMPQ